MKASFLFFPLLLFNNLVAANDLPASCQFSCSAQCESELTRLERKIRFYRDAECGGSQPPPSTGGSAVLYRSDRCDSSMVAIINPGTSCNGLGSQNIWGVKLNGQCLDISDAPANQVCERFKAGGRGSQLFRSDNCTSNAMASIGPETNCKAMGRDNIWAARVGGECGDISDSPFEDTCERFKAGNDGVLLYKSDSCSSKELVGSVGFGSDCTAAGVRNGPRVWAVKIQGQCEDISDMNFEEACKRFGGTR